MGKSLMEVNLKKKGKRRTGEGEYRQMLKGTLW